MTIIITQNMRCRIKKDSKKPFCVQQKGLSIQVLRLSVLTRFFFAAAVYSAASFLSLFFSFNASTSSRGSMISIACFSTSIRTFR